MAHLHAGLLQEHEGTLPAGNAAQLQRRRRRSLGTSERDAARRLRNEVVRMTTPPPGNSPATERH
eukprot:scaffold2113_cov233-Pinguiococcus_pyrenoidosus.AAC.12